MGLHPPPSASAAAVASDQRREAVEDGLELVVIGPAAKLGGLAAVEKMGCSAEHGQILRRLADPAPGGEQPVFFRALPESISNHVPHAEARVPACP